MNTVKAGRYSTMIKTGAGKQSVRRFFNPVYGTSIYVELFIKTWFGISATSYLSNHL